MILVGLLKWWYIDGWIDQLSRSKLSMAKMADTFSIGLLMKTWFSPFRQISADDTGNNIQAKLAAFGNRLFSRLIGAFMRSLLIILGTVVLLLLSIINGIKLLMWPIMPIMPLAGLLMMVIVGAPWKIL